MPPCRLPVLLVCSLVLLFATACAPPQPLTDQDKLASIERLQKLKRELAALKAELAETRAKEQQTGRSPILSSSQPPEQPAWFFRIGSNPLPSGYRHHATLLAGKQANPHAVAQVVELVQLLQADPASQASDRTLFIVPALNQASPGFSFEDYDQHHADELLSGWSGSVADAGPFLLIESVDAASGLTGRLLVNLNGLQDAELGNLLQGLQRLSANDATDLLSTLLRQRQGIPASVTSFGDDFSLGWSR